MYTAGMRRIQLYIDEELDERLTVEARKANTSKAALIRESVAARYGKRTSVDDDPLSRLIGTVEVKPASVDDVVYGR